MIYNFLFHLFYLRTIIIYYYLIYYGNVLQLIELQILMISGGVREQGQLYRGRT